MVIQFGCLYVVYTNCIGENIVRFLYVKELVGKNPYSVCDILKQLGGLKITLCNLSKVTVSNHNFTNLKLHNADE